MKVKVELNVLLDGENSAENIEKFIGKMVRYGTEAIGSCDVTILSVAEQKPTPAKYYGVWNNMKKEFQFGICEKSKRKASDKLFSKIGKDAYKYRFEIKKIPPHILSKIAQK